MINQDKWIDSLPKLNLEYSKTANQLDHEKWLNTIPIKAKYNSAKKYSVLGILFVCGLLFVSVIKNETRNLQKEINNLEASIDVIKFNLDQAILDNEVITSPENISLLAREYLNIDLIFYKRSQIKQLNSKIEKFIEPKKTKNLTVSVKSLVAKRIGEKKLEIKKLQEMYSNPKSIPKEIKIQVAKQIDEKKSELKNIYDSPKDVITLVRVGKWSAIQLVKAFLGMPIVPGR
jgi:hypothetical protein